MGRVTVLSHRVDAYYLAFQGKLREDARQALVAAQVAAAANGADGPLDFAAGDGVIRGAVSSRSREGWWTITNTWLSVKVDETASHDWLVEVKPSALLLMNEGPLAALKMAREVARALLEDVRAERLRRLDLCADMTGMGLRTLDVEAFLQHHRLKNADISQRQQYWRAGKRTGFMWGKGDAVCRLYDKTEHLRLGLDDAKADDERAEWTQAGWNGTDDVARLEFQLRGRLLDELDLRDPEKALERLDAVWAYATKKWLRLVDRAEWQEQRTKKTPRKDRCSTDPRWEAFQAVIFRAKCEPAQRVRAPGIPQARRAVSAITNYCASIGALAGRKGDGRTATASWSNEFSAAWVREQLFVMAKPTLIKAADDLIGTFDDARAAAAHLYTKQAAANLKFCERQKTGVLEVSTPFSTATVAA